MTTSTSTEKEMTKNDQIKMLKLIFWREESTSQWSPSNQSSGKNIEEKIDQDSPTVISLIGGRVWTPGRGRRLPTPTKKKKKTEKIIRFALCSSETSRYKSKEEENKSINHIFAR